MSPEIVNSIEKKGKKVLETFYVKWNFVMNVNPLTPMSDQERIFPYNINTISIQYQPNKWWE